MRVRVVPVGRFEYYVHYVDFDRRLDAWVSFKELVDVDTPEGRAATAKRKGAKHEVPNALTKKRDHNHGGMNETVAAFEREHEELTKVCTRKITSPACIGKADLCFKSQSRELLC